MSMCVPIELDASFFFLRKLPWYVSAITWSRVSCKYVERRSGFGGLEVACWPLIPKFAGSHPAEAFGILGQKKILSMPSSFGALRRESGHLGKIPGHFSPTVPPSAARCSRVVTHAETPGGESWNL